MTGLLFFAFLTGVAFDWILFFVLGAINARRNAAEYKAWSEKYARNSERHKQ